VARGRGSSLLPVSDYRAALSPHPEGVVVAVWAVPGAKRTHIVGVHANAVRVRVAAAPEAGRANKAITQVLRSTFGLRVDLLSGATSRRKRFLVRGGTADGVIDSLEGAGKR
jgi:uncharacterized protein (TIGR00251 family)